NNGTSPDLAQPLGVDPLFNSCDPSVSQESYTNWTGGIINPQEDPSTELQSRTALGTSAARSFVGFDFLHSSVYNAHVEDFSVYGDPFEVINQLFAGVNLGNNRYIWNRDGGNLIDQLDRFYTAGPIDTAGNGSPAVISTNDVRADQGNPPTVWSLLSGSCVGTECEEGDTNSLTLNDQNNGDIKATSFLRAYLKFYAAADKNQLPIRRVIIDWGDELVRTDGFQGSDSEDNFYKNHRGLDSGTDNSICDLSNEWGETPESCDPNYFSYSHVYICKPEVIEDNARACTYDARGVVTNSPCWVENGVNGVTDRSCVFQPAVHIRDNWGWCSGECTFDGEPGCFEGSVDSLAESSDTRSECAYNYSRAPGGIIDPWVYYDGTVIVDPQ
ncbi:MAG: hypothetical protein QG626_640, partial [Patescibacteria group bacterium]|nr:hypothetical protein [Patescibacteria group bacterium]